MHSETEYIVHEIVVLGDRVEHLVHSALFLTGGHTLVTEATFVLVAQGTERETQNTF